MAADPEREALVARAANLLANGGSVRSVAAALGVGRTAAALAAVAAEESADAVLLDELTRQAADAGDVRTALAIVRERRLGRVERKRSAALALALPEGAGRRLDAIEAAAVDGP